jgi:uncharacterized membrane protein
MCNRLRLVIPSIVGCDKLSQVIDLSTRLISRRFRRFTMATLLAITYPDSDRAKQAMESVDWSHFDRLINVKAACWLSKEDGELKVHPRGHPVAARATAGSALGLLVGGLVGLPVVGIAAGAMIGTHKGRQKEAGIDDEFLSSIGSELDSGGSAIVVLVEEGADTAKAAADLAQYGGKVHSADLPPEGLARFQTMLDLAQQDTQAQSGDATVG